MNAINFTAGVGAMMSVFHRLTFLFLLILAGLTISACASNPTVSMPLELRNVEASDAIDRSYTPRVITLTDKRHNTELGNIPGRLSHTTEHPMEWVRTSLKNRGYVFAADGKGSPQNFCDIHLELNSLYVDAKHSSKSANAVFTIRHGHELTATIIRGRSASLLWVGNGNEYSGALQNGLTDAIDKLDEALSKLCG